MKWQVPPHVATRTSSRNSAAMHATQDSSRTTMLHARSHCRLYVVLVIFDSWAAVCMHMHARQLLVCAVGHSRKLADGTNPSAEAGTTSCT